MTLILLKAGGLSVSVKAASVRQIVPAAGVMHVPLTRPEVAGVVARDGRVIPVYELRSLGIENPPEASGPRGLVTEESKQIVILEHEGALAGILVDSTDSVRGGEAGGPERVLDAQALLTAAGALEPGMDGDRAAQTGEGES